MYTCSDLKIVYNSSDVLLLNFDTVLVYQIIRIHPTHRYDLYNIQCRDLPTQDVQGVDCANTVSVTDHSACSCRYAYGELRLCDDLVYWRLLSGCPCSTYVSPKYPK